MDPNLITMNKCCWKSFFYIRQINISLVLFISEQMQIFRPLRLHINRNSMIVRKL